MTALVLGRPFPHNGTATATTVARGESRNDMGGRTAARRVFFVQSRRAPSLGGSGGGLRAAGSYVPVSQPAVCCPPRLRAGAAQLLTLEAIMANQFARTSASVITLPTAYPHQVVNPGWKGRYPANVTRFYGWRVGVGSLASITDGPNIGRIVRVVGRKKDGSGRFSIKGVDCELITLDEDGRRGSSAGPVSIEPFRLRPVIARTAKKAEAYSLPLWPARWEKALRKMQGDRRGEK